LKNKTDDIDRFNEDGGNIPAESQGEVVNYTLSGETANQLLDFLFPSNSYEDETYQYVRAVKRGLPDGTKLVECYETPASFVIVGVPAEDSGHSCDEMGCGQSHVLYRFLKPPGDLQIGKDENSLDEYNNLDIEEIADMSEQDILDELAKIDSVLAQKENDY